MRPPFRRHLSRAGHGRLAGALLVGTLFLAGLLGPLLIQHDPLQQGPHALLGPSAEHLLGTDEVGRDNAARVVHGLRTDLVIVLYAVPSAAVVGAAIGLLTALSRSVGWVAQSTLDLLLGVPVIVLGAGLTLVYGLGLRSVVLAVVLATLPTFGRHVHAALQRELAREYVTAARSLGADRGRILVKEMLPNITDGITALAAMATATAVTVEGGLSVMGLGVQPPAPSLGSSIRDGAPYLLVEPIYALAPVAVVVLLVLGCTLLAGLLGPADETGRG